MNAVLIFLTMSVSIMAGVNSCKFGEEAVAEIYTRFDTFRTKKKTDKVEVYNPIDKFTFRRISEKRSEVSIRINNNSVTEYYDPHIDDTIRTTSGKFFIGEQMVIAYNPVNSEDFSFKNSTTEEKFQIRFQSLDDLPRFEENIPLSMRIAVLKMVLLRHIMFQHNDFLFRDFKHVTLFKLSRNPTGFDIEYQDNLDDKLLVVLLNMITKEISGQVRCGNKYQKFIFHDGSVFVETTHEGK